MRCKVTCTKNEPYSNGFSLAFSAVCSGSEENKEFFKYTPSGNIEFGLVNESTAAKYEVGKEYYVDFSPALAV